ncbi:hypothetical protein OIDMADRAFT_50279 [Oidiodendron maius Zn]|uniref:Uncharacterized protein n=1 Tax=Oidiodendron maius (strain Zn) TaxID=913774 RepID=A0A0C3H852_OIDMZ|nr:hypothetical protein OIDMADRAFT_50279 [Oidiodendron maius Zn]
MSTSWFSRVWGKTPPKIEPAVAATPEQQAEERAAFEKAVTDAVAAAIKNDEFTQAVATNLASQLQPSLKAALDISSVEAKLLAANDQLAKRLDDVDAQTTGKLADLSSLVDSSNTTTAGKVSAVEAAISQIAATLSELGSNVKDLQAQVASPDTTLLSEQTSKLDNIAAELKAIQTQIASPDTSLLASHTAKLDNIASELVAIKENPETGAALRTITSDLTSIKADIKDNDSSTKILEGIKLSNDSQTALTAALAEIKADIKDNDSSTKILEGIKLSNDSHTALTATLAEIKAANDAAAPALAGLETKVGTVITTLSAIQNSDIHNEILSASKASNESHAAHAVTLSEIKAATATPVKIPEPTDISGLETSVKSIITALGSQGTTLEEIKAAATTPAPVAEKTDLTSLEASVKTIITNLDSQTVTLSEIKTGSSNTEILSAIKSQDTVLADIKTGSSSAEILSAIKDQDSVLAEIKASTTSTEISASIQAVKSDISASKDAVIEKVDSLKTTIAAIPAAAPPSVEGGKVAETANGKIEDDGVAVEAKEVASEA